MTDKEKAKAYDKALERARKQKYDYQKEFDKTDKNSQLAGILRAGISAIELAFPELAENEDEKIRKEINTLYSDIDTCISELLKARTDKDSEAEGKALFKMEGLMVGTLQDLSCIEAYLEKQKEQDKCPEYCVRSHCIGCPIYEKQKEPHYTKRNALFDKCVANCDPEIMKEVSDEIDSQLKKEQKLVEPSDEELQRHQDELHDFKMFAARQAKEYHISFVHDFEWNNFCVELLSYFNKQKPAECIPDSIKFDEGFKTGREVGFREGVESVKPAEWSEEDLRMLSDIVGYITGTGSSSGITKQERVDFLDGLPKRFNLQPKQEWSEEDEAAFGDLMWCIEQARKSAKDENDLGNIWFAENWLKTRLKSLPERFVPQSKQEWSEEDDMLMDELESYILQDKEFNDEQKSWRIKRLKSLRTQPKKNDTITPNKKFFQWIYDRLINVHNEKPNVDYMISFKRRIEELSVDKPSWKPSEEQMKALYYALNDAISLYSDKVSPLYEEISRTHFDVLESLYNDLKKL